MTDEVAGLNIKVDATSVDAGKNSLREFSQAGRETKVAASEATSAIAQMAEQIKAADSALRAEYASQKQSATALNEQAKAAKDVSTATGAMNAALRANAEIQATATGAMKANADATVLASIAQKQLTSAIQSNSAISAKAIKDAGGLENAVKIMEAAHKTAIPSVAGLGKAVDDAEKSVKRGGISTSLFTRELIVLGREAGRGDFTRMAGSATLLAQAFGAIEFIANPVGLSILAIGATIAGVIGVMLAGEKESSAFANSLIATGNYAGMTADSFDAMSHRIAASQDVGIRSVKGVVSELVASGKFTSDTIELMAQNAEMFAKLTGKHADDIAKDYETMKGGVVRWAVKHEEVYHDLTLSQIDYINQLEKTGQHHAAELQAMEDINKAVKDRVAPTFGTLQRVLHSVANEASEMWDKILGIGRQKTIGEQINEAQKTIDSMYSSYNLNEGNSPALAAKRAEAEEKLMALQKQKMEIDRQAAESAKKAQDEDDAIRKKYDNQQFKGHRTPVDRVKERQEELNAEIAGNRLVADAYDDSTAAGLRAIAMKRALVDAAKANGQASQFEALEVSKAVTAAIANGEKQLAQTKQKTVEQMAVNDLMRDTGISQQEANQTAKDAVEIARLQAAADNATGQDKERALRVIRETKDAQDAANRSAHEGAIINSTNDLRASNAELDKQLGLINSTNRERAVALAIMQAKRDLEKQGVHDFTDPTATAYIKEKVSQANKQQDLNDGIGDTIKQQQFYVKLVDEMASRTRSAASDMADAFGSVGQAVGDLTTVFSDHFAEVSDMQLDYDQRVRDANGNQEKIDALEKARLEDSRQLNVKYYGDILHASSEMFGKQTAAYKVLHAAEEAYRLFEFAMSVKSIFVHTEETASKVANNTVQTASNVTTGASKMFADMGPLGFAAVAAMMVVMAALGFHGGGGGGGVDIAKQRQDSQGSGTVFGDSSAKSDSISKSLEQATRNSNQMLEYTSQMATSLRAIQSALDVTANAVIRATTNGGSLDTSGLKLGTSKSGDSSGIFGAIGGLLFGSTKTTSLQDLGLDFGTQSLSSILSGGVQGSAYQDVLTQTKKKVLGFTVSNKSKSTETSTNIDDELSGDLTRLVASLKDGVLSAANVLGIQGAEATLQSMELAIGRISFKDMSGDQIEKALEAVFSAVGDNMATAILPTITKFQKAGEGAMETLTRLARDYQVVDVTLQAMGKTMGVVGVSSIDAREHLVDLAGGLDDFASQGSFFVTNFLNDAQQLAPIRAAVSTEMHRLGLDLVTTKDQFAQVVLGLDLTTTTGQETYAALMKVAPAFAKVAEATTTAAQTAIDNADKVLKAANDNVDKKSSTLISIYQDSSKAIQSVIDKMTKLNDALKKYNITLTTSTDVGLSPEDSYTATRALFESTAAAAQGGDAKALEDLPTVAEAFRSASRTMFASTERYFQDLERIKSAVQGAISISQQQITDAEKQQQSLDSLVNNALIANGILTRVHEGIVDVNNSAITIASAISDLQAAVVAATAAKNDRDVLDVTTPQAPIPALTISAPGLAQGVTPSGGSTVVVQPLADNDTKALLQQVVDGINASNDIAVAAAEQTQDLQQAQIDAAMAQRRAIRNLNVQIA
jgi:hypothetical protein